jgi:DHA3 family tetracycline resistance protein-like MFS transporter
MTLFKCLTYRPFAWLWSGQSISRLGDSLYQIALAWWVVEKTGTAAVMGSVFIFSFVPTTLFVLVGGLVVDRFSRVHVMLLSDGLRGSVCGGLAWLALTRQLEVWHVYLASLAFGCVSAFFQPAYAALVPEITPGEVLPSANALTSLSAETSGVIGPALATLIIGWGDASAAFAIDGLSFFVSAVCLLPLLRQPVPSRTSPRAGVLDDARQGFRTVFASAWLWMTILILALLNLTGRSPMNVSLPFLVRNNLHAGVGPLGWLYSTFSLGSILGAVGVGRLPPRRRRGRLVYGALGVVGLMTFVVGLPMTLSGLAAAIFLLAAALAVANLVWSHLLQDHIARDRMGRVASINLLGATGLLPIGFGLAGWATDRFGAPLVFMVGGVLTAGLASIGLAQPAIRDLD